MQCDKHKKTIVSFNGSLDELAEDIGNLHYESLQTFLVLLSNKLDKDSKKDDKAKRYKLAFELDEASFFIAKASISIKKAYNISKPYMK